MPTHTYISICRWFHFSRNNFQMISLFLGSSSTVGIWRAGENLRQLSWSHISCDQIKVTPDGEVILMNLVPWVPDWGEGEWYVNYCEQYKCFSPLVKRCFMCFTMTLYLCSILLIVILMLCLGSIWFCLWFVVSSVNMNLSHRKNSYCKLNITVWLTDWSMWNVSLFFPKEALLWFCFIVVIIFSRLSEWIWHLLRLKVILFRPYFLLCLLEVRT